MSVLSSITHMNDIKIMKELAKHTTTILDICEQRLRGRQSYYLDMVESAVCVLTHTISIVLSAPHTTPDFVKLVPLPRIIHFFLDVVRLPISTALSFDHFIQFSFQLTSTHPAIFKAIPDSLDLLVACSRANDICVRNSAFRALDSLYRGGDTFEAIAQAFAQATSEFDASADRSTEIPAQPDEESETMSVLEVFGTIGSFIKNPRRDIAEFGLQLADMIMRNEDIVRLAVMNVEHTLDMNPRIIRSIAPGCHRFVDILPLCSQAVRSRGTTDMNLKADILQLEHLLATGQEPAAYDLAHSCTDRHPSVPLFYYVLAGDDDMDDITSLRFAEKALQCTGISDNMKQEMLWLASTSADNIASAMLNGRPADILVNEVMALANKSMAHARAFMSIAPPDSSQIISVVALIVRLAFLTGGSQLSEDLNELEVSILSPNSHLHVN